MSELNTRYEPGRTTFTGQTMGAVFTGLLPVLIAVAPSAVSGDELVAVFQTEDLASDPTCPGPPLPIVNITGPESTLAAEKKTLVHRYQRKLNDNFDAYLLSANDLRLVNCVPSWRYLWGRDGAMLSEMNTEGEFVRKSTLAPSVMTLLKIHNNPHFDDSQVSVMVGWLNVPVSVIRQDSTRLESSSRYNNNSYWAAWSVMAGAIATQNRNLFEWSIDLTVSGLDQGWDDGLLPLELNRDAEAPELHHLAVAPLDMTAELATANGVDLYTQGARALHRVIQRTLEAPDDPDEFDRVVGVSLTLNSRFDEEMAPWIEVFGERFPERVDTGWWNVGRSSSHRLVGGNVELFNASLLPN